ncbi:hypothetical protein SNE40_013962 [Patella caerulea]|uniref:TNFR-Cys domain-containing protein n=1 Tax=Patella caerulea TaxID=87958 RepID=A0AAN8PPS6_PATCE
MQRLLQKLDGLTMTQSTYLLCLILVLCVDQTLAECRDGCDKGYYCDEHTGKPKCVECPPGKYSMTKNTASSCEDCRSQCPIGQVEVQACTKISDLICQCPTGEYEELQVDGEGFCKKCTVCGNGQKIEEECTPKADRKCSGKPKSPEDTKTTESTTHCAGTINNKNSWQVFITVAIVGFITYKCFFRRVPRI